MSYIRCLLSQGDLYRLEWISLSKANLGKAVALDIGDIWFVEEIYDDEKERVDYRLSIGV